MTITGLRNDKAARVLELAYADGATAPVSHAALRAGCRCGTCTAARRAGSGPVVDTAIRLDQIDPVGAYGVQLTFSDGHDRGIYPWHLLQELAHAGEEASKMV